MSPDKKNNETIRLVHPSATCELIKYLIITFSEGESHEKEDLVYLPIKFKPAPR